MFSGSRNLESLRKSLANQTKREEHYAKKDSSTKALQNSNGAVPPFFKAAEEHAAAIVNKYQQTGSSPNFLRDILKIDIEKFSADAPDEACMCGNLLWGTQ